MSRHILVSLPLHIDEDNGFSRAREHGNDRPLIHWSRATTTPTMIRDRFDRVV
jgi:hypothetical protein